MAGELPPVIGELRLSIDDFIAKLDEAKQRLADFSDSTGEAKVGVDTGDANEKLDDLKGRVEEIDDAHADATVGADTEEATAKLDEVEAKKEEVGASPATATVDANTSEANAKLDEIEAKKKAVSDQPANVAVHANTASADSGLSETTAKLLQFGALAPGVATLVGGAFAALPGILAGVSAGFGSLLMGIHNITAALDAYKQVTATSSQIGNEMAQMALSNAQTLANAAAQVESAQMQLSQAQMSSYDQVHQAQEQVVQSTQQLEAAQFAQRAAQVALTEATMQAKFQLQDYQTQIADMGLQIKAAIVAQQQAQLSLQETMGDPAATQLQREQAQITYQQATQQITDLQVQYKQLQETAAYQSAKGVQGSDAVVQAQQQVTEATYGMHNATVGAADAQLYLNQAQIESVQNLTQAQRQLNMALYNQAVAIKQVALVAAQPIGAYSQLQSALAMLSPAGQKFVEWWHSNMTPIFEQMYASDQSALLPGLQQIMTTLGPYFKALVPILDEFAQGFDQMAAPIAKFLSSSKGISELQTTMQSGLGFMKDMGAAILDVIKALGSLGVTAGPAVKIIGEGIKDAAAMFMQWAQSPAAKRLVTDFVQIATAVGGFIQKMGGFPALGAMLTAFSGPLGIIVSFLPQLMPLAVPFVKLGLALLQIVETAAAPVVEAVAIALGKVATALMPMMPSLTRFAEMIGSTLASAVAALTPLLLELIPPLLHIFEAIFKDLTPVIGPLVKALIDVANVVATQLVQFLPELMPIINSLASVILTLVEEGVVPLLHELLPLIPVILQWQYALLPLLPPLLQLMNAILKPLLPVIVQLVPPIVQLAAAIGSTLVTALQGAKPLLQDISDIITPLAGAVGKVTGVIGSVLGGIIHGGSSVLNRLSGGGSQSGNVHKAAAGGYVAQPTMLLAGEAGPELILPLNNPARMAQLLANVATPLPNAGTAGGGLPPTGGTGVAPQQNITVYAQTNASPQMIANEIGWAQRTAVK